MADLPPQLKTIKKYLMRAKEVSLSEKVADASIITYYMKRFALEAAIQIKKENEAADTAEVQQYILSLFSEIEQEKTQLRPHSESEAHQLLMQFGMKLYKKANDVDVQGKATKKTAKLYYYAANYFTALGQFQNLPQQHENIRDYVKSRSAEILRDIKQGRDPLPPSNIGRSDSIPPNSAHSDLGGTQARDNIHHTGGTNLSQSEHRTLGTSLNDWNIPEAPKNDPSSIGGGNNSNGSASNWGIPEAPNNSPKMQSGSNGISDNVWGLPVAPHTSNNQPSNSSGTDENLNDPFLAIPKAPTFDPLTGKPDTSKKSDAPVSNNSPTIEQKSPYQIAVEIVSRAVTEDKSKNYGNALALYKDCLSYFMKTLQSEQDPNRKAKLTQTIGSYLSRAEVLKKELATIPPPLSTATIQNLKANQSCSNEFVQGMNVLSKALEEDNKNNAGNSLKLYGNALEKFMGALKLESDAKKKTAIVAALNQFMTRAEQLKSLVKKVA